jgi:hypothetical protein
MIYTIITPKAVQKQLDALPDDVYDRIAVKIQHLAKDPRPDGVVKMNAKMPLLQSQTFCLLPSSIICSFQQASQDCHLGFEGFVTDLIKQNYDLVSLIAHD